MLRKLLEGLRNMRKKGVEAQPPADETGKVNPVSESSEPPKTAKALPWMAFLAAGVVMLVAGFVTYVTIAKFITDRKDPPSFASQKDTGMQSVHASNLPQRPIPSLQQDNTLQFTTAGEKGDASAKTVPGQGYQYPTVLPPPEKQPAQIAMKQDAPPKKELSNKPISDYDPFKAEFEKKYQEAEKKEKRQNHRNGDTDGLRELERSINRTPSPFVQPVVQMPPPPPPPLKDIKLLVSGVVISKNDAYALTDRGIMRVGSDVDTFTVKKITFDTVTVQGRENDKDVRNVNITGKSAHAGANSTQTAPQVTPR